MCHRIQKYMLGIFNIFGIYRNDSVILCYKTLIISNYVTKGK